MTKFIFPVIKLLYLARAIFDKFIQNLFFSLKIHNFLCIFNSLYKYYTALFQFANLLQRNPQTNVKISRAERKMQNFTI
jgi:hypothetical protein